MLTTLDIDMPSLTDKFADVLFVALAEHEVPHLEIPWFTGRSKALTEKTVEEETVNVLTPHEIAITRPSYEEVFEELDRRISNATAAFRIARHKADDQRVWVRVTYRQKNLIAEVNDQYIGVFSIIVLEADPALPKDYGKQFNFERALNKLIDGFAVRRQSWSNNYKIWYELNKLLNSKDRHYRGLTAKPYFVKQEGSYAHIGWTPSTDDLLATDWMVDEA